MGITLNVILKLKHSDREKLADIIPGKSLISPLGIRGQVMKVEFEPFCH